MGGGSWKLCTRGSPPSRPTTNWLCWPPLKARYAISYADGFAAATAMLQGAPLVTGDPELRVMAAKEKALRLEWIGR